MTSYDRGRMHASNTSWIHPPPRKRMSKWAGQWNRDNRARLSYKPQSHMFAELNRNIRHNSPLRTQFIHEHHQLLTQHHFQSNRGRCHHLSLVQACRLLFGQLERHHHRPTLNTRVCHARVPSPVRVAPMPPPPSTSNQFVLHVAPQQAGIGSRVQ